MTVVLQEQQDVGGYRPHGLPCHSLHGGTCLCQVGGGGEGQCGGTKSNTMKACKETGLKHRADCVRPKCSLLSTARYLA